VAVASKTVQGKAWAGGAVQDFAYQSYNICCGKGDVWGDGVTPVECALALDGATHILLEGAKHVPIEKGGDWYGAGRFLEEWVHYLHPSGDSSSGSSSGSGSGSGSSSAGGAAAAAAAAAAVVGSSSGGSS
jgi:hypothetical protein